RSLTDKGLPVKGFEGRLEAGQVARQAGQQVARDVVRKPQSAGLGERFQVPRLVLVPYRQELIDETPGEAGTKVVAKLELRRRFCPRGEHTRSAVARFVDRDEERLLARSVKRLDIVGDDERRIGARRGEQKMRAPATGCTP